MNLGSRFELRTQKLPYEKISGHFDDFIDLGHTVRVMKLLKYALSSIKVWASFAKHTEENNPQHVYTGSSKMEQFTIFSPLWRVTSSATALS